jgi:hypothetical protein
MPMTAHDIRRSLRLAPLVTSVLVLVGCAGVTPIRDLLNDPARYDGKTVRIEGEVKGSLGGLGVGAYEIKDKTASIPVVSQVGDPPPTGSTVGVKGKFQSLFTLGLRSLAVIREESRFIP